MQDIGTVKSKKGHCMGHHKNCKPMSFGQKKLNRNKQDPWLSNTTAAERLAMFKRKNGIAEPVPEVEDNITAVLSHVSIEKSRHSIIKKKTNRFKRRNFRKKWGTLKDMGRFKYTVGWYGDKAQHMFGGTLAREINPRDRMVTPGPGDYETVKCDQLKKKSPGFSIRMRLEK